MHVSAARSRGRKPSVATAVTVAVSLLALLLAAGSGFTLAAQADEHGGGANVSGPYDPSEPGAGDENQGKGKAPDNGSVGKADGKNPPGQVGKAEDRGYECDDNSGIGDKGGNPAHTGCRDDGGNGGNGGNGNGGNGIVGGVDDDNDVAGVEETAPRPAVAPAAVPTAVDAGLGVRPASAGDGPLLGLLATGLLMLLVAGTFAWRFRVRGAHVA